MGKFKGKIFGGDFVRGLRTNFRALLLIAGFLFSCPSQAVVDCSTYGAYGVPSPTYPCDYMNNYCTTSCGTPSDTSVASTAGPGGVCACQSDTYVYPNSQYQQFDPDTGMPTYDSGCTLPGGQTQTSKTCTCNLTCPAGKVLDNTPNCACVEVKFSYQNYWTNYSGGLDIHLIGEPETVGITNNGAVDATGCTVLMTDHAGHPGSSSHFTLTQNSPSCVGTIPKGASCNFNIQSPATNSGWVVDLQISCSNGSSPAGNITVTDDYAGGVGGVIPVYNINPSAASFGNVMVGAYSAMQTMTIVNSNGVAGLNCNLTYKPQPGTTVPADFEVTHDCFVGNPDYETGCKVYITANPQSPGPKAIKIAYTCALATGGNYLETGYTYTVTGLASPTPDPGTGVGGSCASCPAGSTYDSFIGKCAMPALTGVSGSTINSCTCSVQGLTYDPVSNNCSLTMGTYLDSRENLTGKCSDLICTGGLTKYYTLEPSMTGLGSAATSVLSGQNYYKACTFYEMDSSGSFPGQYLESSIFGVFCAGSAPTTSTYLSCSSNTSGSFGFMTNQTYWNKKSLGCGVDHPYNWDPIDYLPYYPPSCPLGTSQYGNKCVVPATCLNGMGCPAGYTLSGTQCVQDCPPPVPTTPPPPGYLTFTTSISSPIGDVYVGSSSSAKTVTFKNISTFDAIGCTTTALSGPFAGQFNLVGTCPSTIPAGGQCDLQITGNPSSLGGKNVDVAITCTGDQLGGGATLNVSEMGQNPPLLSFNPNTKDFGVVAPGTSGTPLLINVVNTGSLTALNCTAPTISDPNFTITGNTCGAGVLSSPTSGCSFQLTPVSPTGPAAVFQGTLSMTCTNTSSPNYSANTYNFPASSGIFKFTSGSICTIYGQYDLGSGCQCPTGYEVTDVTGGSGKACRPIVPSFEYYKGTGADSDGFPVCGTGRLPTNGNYELFPSSYKWQPMSSSSVTNAITGDVYAYATDGIVAPTPHPIYIYDQMQRCVCSSVNGYTPPTVVGTGIQLATQDPSFLAVGANHDRFVPDTFETINQQTRANGVQYGEVAIATDGSSNGFLGSVYSAGQSVCGCPNVNEKAYSISPTNNSQTGSYCQPMMAADANTNNFKVLTTYNKTLHLTQNQSDPAALKTVESVKVPTQSGTSYQAYRRRIWTCAPPFEPSFAGSTISCVFVASHNTCDDGTGSGNPSVVSNNVNGGTPQLRYRNTVNKRLACCLNEFDPTNPSAVQKFDCVDNSTKTSDFDTLWKSDIDGAPNAVALTNSAGQLTTGFYALNGSRCSEYSEFAGTIRAAKVNQAIASGQQSSAGGSLDKNAISYTGTSIAQPAFVSADPKWSNFAGGKTIPSTADQMRRCPILVRAAIRTTCPGVVTGAIPGPTKAFPNLPSALQSYDDGTTVRCSVAAQVDVVLRVEQIYEISGMAKMKTIDDSSDYAGQAAHLQVSDLIRNKTAGSCPGGASLMADGSCAFQ